MLRQAHSALTGPDTPVGGGGAHLHSSSRARVASSSGVTRSPWKATWSSGSGSDGGGRSTCLVTPAPTRGASRERATSAQSFSIALEQEQAKVLVEMRWVE